MGGMRNQVAQADLVRQLSGMTGVRASDPAQSFAPTNVGVQTADLSSVLGSFGGGNPLIAFLLQYLLPILQQMTTASPVTGANNFTIGTPRTAATVPAAPTAVAAPATNFTAPAALNALQATYRLRDNNGNFDNNDVQQILRAAEGLGATGNDRFDAANMSAYYLYAGEFALGVSANNLPDIATVQAASARVFNSRAPEDVFLKVASAYKLEDGNPDYNNGQMENVMRAGLRQARERLNTLAPAERAQLQQAIDQGERLLNAPGVGNQDIQTINAAHQFIKAGFINLTPRPGDNRPSLYNRETGRDSLGGNSIQNRGKYNQAIDYVTGGAMERSLTALFNRDFANVVPPSQFIT